MAPLGRFFDGASATAHPVWPLVQGGALSIRGGDGAVLARWPLKGIVQRGAADGEVVLSHRNEKARLIVSDPALIAALRLRQPRSPGRPWPGWLAPLLACAAVLGVLAAAVDAAPDLLAPLIPMAWEDSAGAGVEAALLAGHRRCTGAEGQQALERLVAALAAADEIAAPVRVTVVDDPMVNAFTLPGNRVLVMRGLIDRAGDGDELAGVVAHELGHVGHRDPARQLVRDMALGVVAQALGWGGFDAGSAARLLLGLSYGRAAEAAADASAIAGLDRAGLRTDGLARFFARIERDDVAPRFLSDHPPTAERRLRSAGSAAGRPAFTEAEWQAVRAMCGR